MSDVDEVVEPPKMLTVDLIKSGLSQIGRTYGKN